MYLFPQVITRSQTFFSHVIIFPIFHLLYAKFTDLTQSWTCMFRLCPPSWMCLIKTNTDMPESCFWIHGHAWGVVRYSMLTDSPQSCVWLQRFPSHLCGAQQSYVKFTDIPKFSNHFSLRTSVKLAYCLTYLTR